MSVPTRGPIVTIVVRVGISVQKVHGAWTGFAFQHDGADKEVCYIPFTFVDS